MNVLSKNAPQLAAREQGEEQDPGDKGRRLRVPCTRRRSGPWRPADRLQALALRRKGDVAVGILAAFTGLLMTDGYTGDQHLLTGWPASSNAASTESGDAGQS